MDFPDLTLVIGGAASGKSACAEALTLRAGRAPVYLATAQAHDAEMRDKIARHRADRGTGWTTIEAPMDVGPALDRVTNQQIVLLDCATMWLSNHLIAGDDLDRARDGLMDALDACAAPVVIVTNETGLGIVPENALARQFRQAQGVLNQALAARAVLVVNVIAGLPQVLKGQLP